MQRHENILRMLAIRDDAFVESILGRESKNFEASTLDMKTHALVRVAALIGMDSGTAAYVGTVDAALLSGATMDEIVGVLVAVLPAVGTVRAVGAAPKLSLAVGYDLWPALEQRGVYSPPDSSAA